MKDLKELQKLSLDDKIEYSQTVIKEFYDNCGGKVYVSYSGGKDSTVLLHLVRSVYPDVCGMYIDTGLEFPEIYEFVCSTDNVIICKPEMTFTELITQYGYPVVGKNASHWISLAQRGWESGIRQMNADTKFGYKRYKYLVDAPFKVTDKCCKIMKQKPAAKFHKDSGLCPIIGTRADESKDRAEAWIKRGDNHYGKIPSSNPISIWTEKDIWDYIHKFELPYSSIYDKGYDRTGCAFCMFGANLHKDRFIKLKQTHPKLWNYCMKPIDMGGLGMKPVLKYMNIPTGEGVTFLEDFENL